VRVLAPKYLDLLRHIENLSEGEKISVRRLARDKGVSQGTAYRAIKMAEEQGLVSTIARVGTIRIRGEARRKNQELTYKDVARIVEGELLAGNEGSGKTLKKFLIAAMELSAAANYIKPGNLVIVGNREDIQEYALKNGAPILITGGFEINQFILDLAEKNNLPVIVTSYDTFSTAAEINRAIFERRIQKRILLVDDIMIADVFSLSLDSTVQDWYQLLHNTHHTRFPVLNKSGRVVGVVTGRDVAEEPESKSIARVMTREPITVTPRTSVATVSHIMVWKGIELLPVVRENHQLLGIVTRQDVMQALHQLQKQPHLEAGLEDNILRSINIYRRDNRFILSGRVTGYMLNRLGVLSTGILNLFFTHLAEEIMQSENQERGEMENFNFYALKPLPLGSNFFLEGELLESGRQGGLVAMQAFNQPGEDLIATATAWIKTLGG